MCLFACEPWSRAHKVCGASVHKITVERRLPGAVSSMSTKSHEGADEFRTYLFDKTPGRGKHTSSTMTSALRTWSAEHLQSSYDDCLGMSFTTRKRTSLQVSILSRVQLGPCYLAVWKDSTRQADNQETRFNSRKSNRGWRSIVDRGQAISFHSYSII